MINDLSLISGIDIPMAEFGTSIHQPRIREIAYMGETAYFNTIQLFCINKSMVAGQATQMDNFILNKLSNFQIFMMLLADGKNSKDMKNLDSKKKQAILDLLTLFFPTYTASWLPSSIYLNDSERQHTFMIDESTFDVFSQTIKQIGGLDKAFGNDSTNYNPKGKKAAEIALKMQQNRAKISKQQHGGTKGSTIMRYVSVLTIGLHTMSLDDCLNLTVFQLYDLMERYGLYINWDIDLRSRLAGGKPDKEPDDWMKDLT